MTIKFFKKSIKKDNIKVKVNYSYSETIDGLERITIYEKDWSHNLAKIFKDTINNSDTLTDYHEAMRVKIFPDNPLFNDLKSALNNAGKKYRLL